MVGRQPQTAESLVHEPSPFEVATDTEKLKGIKRQVLFEIQQNFSKQEGKHYFPRSKVL
jgi:hypothetical protein